MGSEQSISGYFDIAHHAEPGNVQADFHMPLSARRSEQTPFPAAQASGYSPAPPSTFRHTAQCPAAKLFLRSLQSRASGASSSSSRSGSDTAAGTLLQEAAEPEKQLSSCCSFSSCRVLLAAAHRGRIPPAAVGKTSKISCALSCACGSPAPQPRPARGPSRGCKTPLCPCRR